MSDTQSGRTKRQKIDKTGRLSALEKLKQLKGSKNKYEIDKLENVYEEVDEKEYTKTVIERQSDDWIIDDGESGYIEDGREIFDDDLDDESIQEARKHKITGPKKNKKDNIKIKGNIQNMLMNMSSKKKYDAKLDDDNILGDLMSELKKDNSPEMSKLRTVRNKFCTASKLNEKNIHDKTKLQSTSECEQIQSDDNNDLVIFDKSKNVNLQHIKLNCQMENVISDQSNSQIIIDDEITSASNTTLDIHLKQDIKNSSNSQIIETENEDLSQFIGDFCTDFTNDNVDYNEKSISSINEENKKT